MDFFEVEDYSAGAGNILLVITVLRYASVWRDGRLNEAVPVRKVRICYIYLRWRKGVGSVALGNTEKSLAAKREKAADREGAF